MIESLTEKKSSSTTTSNPNIKQKTNFIPFSVNQKIVPLQLFSIFYKIKLFLSEQKMVIPLGITYTNDKRSQCNLTTSKLGMSNIFSLCLTRKGMRNSYSLTFQALDLCRDTIKSQKTYLSMLLNLGRVKSMNQRRFQLLEIKVA